MTRTCPLAALVALEPLTALEALIDLVAMAA